MRTPCTLIVRLLASAALLGGPAAWAAAGGEVRSAQMLRAQYAALESQLPGGAGRQPWVVESIQFDAGLQGHIHAVLDYPFAEVRAGLNSPQNWCDIVILHIDTKRCAVVASHVKRRRVVPVRHGIEQWRCADDTLSARPARAARHRERPERSDADGHLAGIDDAASDKGHQRCERCSPHVRSLQSQRTALCSMIADPCVP